LLDVYHGRPWSIRWELDDVCVCMELDDGWLDMLKIEWKLNGIVWLTGVFCMVSHGIP